MLERLTLPLAPSSQAFDGDGLHVLHRQACAAASLAQSSNSGAAFSTGRRAAPP